METGVQKVMMFIEVGEVWVFVVVVALQAKDQTGMEMGGRGGTGDADDDDDVVGAADIAVAKGPQPHDKRIIINDDRSAINLNVGAQRTCREEVCTRRGHS
jgi:hypothetical protein